MNIRTLIVSALAAFAVVATSIAPAVEASGNIPASANLVASHLNPKAQVASGEAFSDLGNLSATRYVIVTASGISSASGGKTTITFQGADAAGNMVKRSALLRNGVPTMLDFGTTINPTLDAAFVAIYYTTNQSQTDVSLNVWAPNLGN